MSAVTSPQTVSPLTHQPDVTLLKTWTTSQLIDEWKTGWGYDPTPDFHAHPEVSLYQCNQTQLQFFAPRDIAGAEPLYQRLMQFDWYYMDEKWEYDQALATLKPGQTLLEIGAGSGAFIRKAMARGVKALGLELNERAIAQAQSQNLPIQALNLHDLAQDILAQDINRPDATFDTICSFQVLEHLSDPKDFLDSALALLKPGGRLILSVPNRDSYIRHQYNLLDMPPHHLLRWSARTFRQLERLFPLRLERAQAEPLAEYHIQDFLTTYTHHFHANPIGGRTLGAKLSPFSPQLLPIYEKILHSPLRTLIPGHTLYVEFRKR